MYFYYVQLGLSKTIVVGSHSIFAWVYSALCTYYHTTTLYVSMQWAHVANVNLNTHSSTTANVFFLLKIHCKPFLDMASYCWDVSHTFCTGDSSSQSRSATMRYSEDPDDWFRFSYTSSLQHVSNTVSPLCYCKL